MVTELQQALEALGQLPEAEQRQIAQRVLAEIEQRQWDQLVASPRSKAFLKRLIAEAKKEEIEEGGLAPARNHPAAAARVIAARPSARVTRPT